MPKKILVTTSTFAKFDSSPVRLLEEAGYEVILNPFKRKLTKEESKELLPGYVGLIAGLETLDDEVLSVSDLKVISRCGSGMSNVDLSAAEKRGIRVCNTPDGPTSAVAELTVGAMLNLLRLFPQMNQDLHEGKWNKQTGLQLKNKSVVIIGFGRIGQKVASLLRSFEVHIIAVDPYLSGDFPGVELLPMDEALMKADIVTIHCSGEQEVLGEKQFDLMKQSVFVLNAARGGAISENALIKALNDDKIAGAWLDTFSQEPYDGRLKAYPQVLLTPHIGSYTSECRRDMEAQAAKNLLAALEE